MSRSLFDVPKRVTRLAAYRPKPIPKTCAADGCCVGGMTGTSVPLGKIVDHTTRWFRGRSDSRGFVHTASYGQLFPSDEARDQYLFERGYIVPYFPRPSCWYGLKLPRATRKYLERTGRFDLIPVMLERLDKLSDYDRTGGATPLYRRPRHTTPRETCAHPHCV